MFCLKKYFSVGVRRDMHEACSVLCMLKSCSFVEEVQVSKVGLILLFSHVSWESMYTAAKIVLSGEVICLLCFRFFPCVSQHQAHDQVWHVNSSCHWINLLMAGCIYKHTPNQSSDTGIHKYMHSPQWTHNYVFTTEHASEKYSYQCRWLLQVIKEVYFRWNQ